MLYEVTLRSSFVGQNQINRFHYNSSGVPAAVSGSYGLAYAMGFVPISGAYPPTALFEAIRQVCSNATSFTSASVRAVGNYAPTDFYELPFALAAPGFRTGEWLSPVLALGFRTTRVRTDIRRATKRFGGIAEEDVNTGGTVAGTAITRGNALRSLLGAALTYNDEGNTITYQPAVLSLQKYTDPEDGKEKRRPYPTLNEQLAHTALGFAWEMYPQLRSQVSRQYGRGI
jgi:hypothetical protein